MSITKKYELNTNPDLWKTHSTGHNSGAFALNIDGWVTPYCPIDDEDDDEDSGYLRSSVIEEMYEDGLSIDEITDALLALDSEMLLAACPWIERINLEDARPDDRVIAYRVFVDEDALEEGEVDDDFHFRVRINGFWFEKCGQDPIRFCGTFADEAPWYVTPYLIYDSEVIYFRFKI